MVTKTQVLDCLEHGKRAQREYVDGLDVDQRSETGTYERWSAKDIIAHMSFWQEYLAQRVRALVEGRPMPSPVPHYEEANLACFTRFCDCPFEEVSTYWTGAVDSLVAAVNAASEQLLTGCPPDRPERPLWMDVVGTAYTHSLSHMTEFYAKSGRAERASQLWQEWGPVVVPLDNGAEWQGTVHYNVACGLALANQVAPAIAELGDALRLRPDLLSWARQDTDLASLHGLKAFRELYAPEHWWAALAAGPVAEAMADQYMRTLLMLRGAVSAFPEEEWRKGDTPYQRPAGLALHAVSALVDCSLAKPGQKYVGTRIDVDWQDRDSSRLPSQETLLQYLDSAERSLAHFLATADLTAPEEMYRWSGSTLLSRAAYFLRHTQHHLAELCLELHRRGLKAPDWQ